MRPADDAFAEYIYSTFPKDVNERCKVESLTLHTEQYFDFRFHYSLKLKVKNEIQEFHVTLNENNVADTFFDHRIPSEVFGINISVLCIDFVNRTFRITKLPWNP